MKITEDHWLEGVRREIIPGGAEMKVRRFLVIHFTSGATALSSINFWRSPEATGASAQLVIDRDGATYQCRPFNRTCGHAGQSQWRDPKTNILYTGLNSCSIGVELANAGDDPKLAAKWTKLPLVTAAHKNGGKPRQWEAYPEAQIARLEEIAKALVARYNLDDIVGHDDIAPSRKVDPGPAFPMGRSRLACGFPEHYPPK